MATEWATPNEFFNEINKEFNFTLDVCALPETAKCYKFFTPEIDGLQQDWSGETFFMNPPYGRGQDVYSWVKKAHDTAQQGGTGVCLLPMSGDTKWFHDFCMKADEIRIVKDRLWFLLDGKAARANHASMLVVFKQKPKGPPKLSTISNFRKPKEPAQDDAQEAA
jgi:phage N-6-adenine-methyltransferase